MTSQQIANNREGAEIYNVAAECKQMVNKLLTKFNLPLGIIPLNNEIVELGYNPNTGFMWIKQGKKTDHKFPTIGKNEAYDVEIGGILEEKRMRKISGVKVKEMMIWVTICDIRVNENDPQKLTFSSLAGISKTFPKSTFELQDEKK